VLKVDGQLVLSFDVGGGQQRVAETQHRLDDGRYHYVQFTRTGSTATLRVDNLSLRHTDVSSSGSSRVALSRQGKVLP